MFYVEIGNRITIATCLGQLAEASNAEDLERILRYMEANRPVSRAKSALIADRAMGVTSWQQLRRNGGLAWDSRYVYRTSAMHRAYQVPLPRSYSYHEEAWFLEGMNRRIVLADRPFYEVSADLAKLEYDLGGRRSAATQNAWFLLMCSGSPSPMKYEAPAMVRWDLAQTVAAIRLYRLRHGVYPKALADLAPEILKKIPIDEYSGKPLIYKIKGSCFIVYSVGENLKDDGGRPDKNAHSGGRGDIVIEVR